MKEVIDELSKRANKICKTAEEYRTAVCAMEKIEVPNKQKVISALKKKEDDACNELCSVRDAIYALQRVCSHVHPDGRSAFRYASHDSHYSYEVCDICGTEVKT